MKEAIKFGDLSIWLKIAIISGWISAISYLYYFIIGFMQGLTNGL